LQVREVREYRFDSEFLATRPEALPVALTGRGAQGGIPNRVQVSAAQRVLSSGDPRGRDGRFVPAGALGTSVAGIEPGFAALSYFVFDLGETACVNADGIWLECAPPDA
jgi:hypothetical protein